ncbi:MAG: glycosyltransferase family 39 protein [Anaerolineales bacterium]
MTTFSRFLKRHWADLAAILLVFAGLALRLRQYLSGRSFWLDEAMLALNIVRRDFAGLLQPLDYDQGAPLGFLFLEKLTISLLRNGELTLRLPPFIAGCLALVFFYVFLRRFLSPAGFLPALAFFAFSDRLIYYTSELKQYIFDVFVLLALLLVFLYAAPKQDDESPPNRAWIPLLLTGILAVWFSHPSVFMLSGIGLTLLWQNRSNGRKLLQVGLVILGWLVSFGGVFLASLSSLAANNFLMDYWQDYFMPMPPWSDPGRYLDVLSHATTYFGLAIPDWLALLIALGGFVALWRLHPPLASVFGLALLAAFGVSALGKYPLGGRMLLFIAPISMGLFGAAFEGLYRALARLRWGAAMVTAALAILLLLTPASLAVERFQTPRMQSNMHPAMAGLRLKYQPEDLIYVYYGGMPAFRYYAPFYGFAEDQFRAGEIGYYRRLEPTLADIESLRGHPRVWILFSHVYEEGGANEREAVFDYIQEQNMGRCREEVREPGTSIQLYLCNFAP